MTTGARVAVLVALLAIVAAPAVTAHSAVSHLFANGAAATGHELRHLSGLALLALLLVSALPLAGALRLLGRTIAARRAMRELDGRSTTRAIEEIPYRSVPLPGVLFFTFGLFRPTIYASESASSELSQGVFRAGILHEREHVRRRDPAWRTALAMLESGLGMFPGVRRVTTTLALECELAADKGALLAGAGETHLFDAMVAAASPKQAQGVGLAGTGVIERLEALTTAVPRRSATSGVQLGWAAAALGGIPLATHALLWAGAVCL